MSSRVSGQYLESTGYGGRSQPQGNVKQFYIGPTQQNSLTYQNIGGVQYQVASDSTTPIYFNNIVIDSMYSSSDRNLKNNIEYLSEDKSNSLLDLKPTQFTFKSDAHKRPHYGFIAQDLEKIYPELVKDCEKGYRKVNYVELIPLIISKMQSMQKEIDELKKIIEHKKTIQSNNLFLSDIFMERGGP
jgi:hypothetical protein